MKNSYRSEAPGRLSDFFLDRELDLQVVKKLCDSVSDILIVTCPMTLLVRTLDHNMVCKNASSAVSKTVKHSEKS